MLAIVWFRRDLRLADNPALTAAAKHGKVLPVFLLDEEDNGDWQTGAASRVWLHKSLQRLNESLNKKLLLLAGRAESALPQLVQYSGATALFYNCRHEPKERESEAKVQRALAGLPIYAYEGNLLAAPDGIKAKNGGVYKVFTPFYKNAYLAALAQSPLPPPLPPPTLQLARIAAMHASSPPPTFKQLQPAPAWGQKILAHWQPGEKAALATARAFAANTVSAYAQQRDFPAKESISRLSPHLHFGEISPRQLWTLISDDNSPFLRQLIWREFSTYLLHHFRDFAERNWRREFDAFPWRKDKRALLCWQRGETGIPIVDAGMHELWQTGYMHNRVRMIVASFLTKNLLLHWQHGARWFWDCLVDADLANNSAGWQWVAGSGADAAPYFRIFNPLLQSEKFDSDGSYLCRFLPQLRRLPPPARHRPWLAGGVRGYPPPMVDIANTRQRALAAYASIKKRH